MANRSGSTLTGASEDGIVEKGSHEELLREEGVYYDLYQMYRELDELNEEF